jgi:hypothetical protein
MLESRIESQCCKWANATHAIKNLKLANMVGIPDRIFMLNGRVIFIEFKAPGKKARAIQTYVHSTLRNNGFSVHVVDNFEAFKLTIERWIHE